MLNIAVCVKQVPAVDEVGMDERGSLVRAGVAARLNPYDLVAVEGALRLKELCGGKVTAVTMGPLCAAEALTGCIAMGADEGILLSDSAFAGADTCATSYTLAQGLRASGPYDVIVCGRQTTDGDTGQVGPQIGEHLGLPHLYNVTLIEQADGNGIVAAQNIGAFVLRARIALPCVLVFAKDAFTPRLPTLKRKLEAKKQTARVLMLSDLSGADASRMGLEGSPTRVERVYPPARAKKEDVLSADPDTLVKILLDRFADLRLIGRRS